MLNFSSSSAPKSSFSSGLLSVPQSSLIQGIALIQLQQTLFLTFLNFTEFKWARSPSPAQSLWMISFPSGKSAAPRNFAKGALKPTVYHVASLLIHQEKEYYQLGYSFLICTSSVIRWPFSKPGWELCWVENCKHFRTNKMS